MVQDKSNMDRLRELTYSLGDRDARLKENTAIKEFILENTTDGYWDWDMVTNEEFLSPRFKKQLGYEDHEMENSPESWMKLMNPEELEKLKVSLGKHIASKGDIPFEAIAKFNHKDNKVVSILCRGEVIKWDEDGTPLRMVGTHIDITKIVEGKIQ